MGIILQSNVTSFSDQSSQFKKTTWFLGLLAFYYNTAGDNEKNQPVTLVILISSELLSRFYIFELIRRAILAVD